jgi:tetratricopeptide (TPR) repeat protein
MGQKLFGAKPEPSNFDMIRDGDRLFREGEFDNAATLYTQAIEAHPSYYVPYLRRSAAQLQLGNHDKALADLDMCLSYHPNDFDAFETRAQVHEAMGDDDLAARERSRIPREIRDNLVPEDEDSELTGDAAKYADYAAGVSAAMKQDQNRKDFVQGNRGMHVRSEHDKKLLKERAAIRDHAATVKRHPPGYKGVRSS